MSDKFADAGNYPAGSEAWSGQPRVIVPSGSEITQGFTPGTPIPAPILNYLFQVAYPDVQIFDANGAWTKPDGALLCHVKMIGTGADGGAGHITGGGGGGGSSGEVREELIPADEMPATAAATITGLGGLTRLSDGAGFILEARAGFAGSDGTGSVGGGGGTLAPEQDTGEAGAGGSAAVGAPGKGMLNSTRFAGGGGGGDNTFAGGAGGRGDCGAARAGGTVAVGGLGGRGYGAGGGGGGGGAADGGGGGSGGSGIGSQLLVASGGLGGAGAATVGSVGSPGVIIVTTWRGLP